MGAGHYRPAPAPGESAYPSPMPSPLDALAAAGAERVFGPFGAGPIEHVRVDDPALAALLAAADARIGGGAGACTDEQGRAFVVHGLRRADRVPAGTPPSTTEHTTAAGDAEPLTLAGCIAVLAGPGAVQGDDALATVRAFARRTGLGIANSWGAKGVFTWDSPHHLGTCGLQSGDFELLGFGAADVVLAIGIDPDETPPAHFSLAPVVEVAPSDLAHVDVRTAEPLPHRMYAALAAVVQPGYERPRHPAHAVKALRDRLPAGGIVTADPGLAGFWVARGFPTTEVGSVVVPAIARPGIGAALAFAAAMRGRPAFAVTDRPDEPETRAVVTLAHDLDVPFELVVWADDVAWSCTNEIVAVAGPIVAWGGIAVPG